MLNNKLTQKDVTQWCSSHYCNEHDCKYMSEYCHIREFVIDKCNECIDKSCKKCDKYV